MVTRNPSACMNSMRRRYSSPEGHWLNSSSARAWNGILAVMLSAAAIRGSAAWARGKKIPATLAAASWAAPNRLG